MISEQIPISKLENFYKSTTPLTNQPEKLFYPKKDDHTKDMTIVNDEKNDSATPINIKDQFKRRVGNIYANLKLLNTSGTLLMQEEVLVPSKEDESISKKDKIKEMINKIFSSIQWNITMLIITILFLFIYDIKRLVIPVTWDIGLNILLYLMLIIFVIDFIASFFKTDEQSYSVMFWLDIIALLIMIFDSDELMMLTMKSSLGLHNDDFVSFLDQATIDTFVRLIQTFKIIRVGKLYKILNNVIRHFEKKRTIKRLLEKFEQSKRVIKKQKVFKQSVSIINNNITNQKNDPFSRKNSIKVTTLFQPNHTNTTINDNPVPITPAKLAEKRKQIERLVSKESKISQKITEGISESMILITFFVLFISIFLEEEFYGTYSFSYRILCQYLDEYKIKYDNNQFYQEILKSLLAGNILNEFPIIQVRYGHEIMFHNKTFSDNLKSYRYDSYWTIYQELNTTVLIIHRAKAAFYTSILNISLYIYIFISLFVLSLLIHFDTQKLIFSPLEKMIKVVDVVSKDPVNSKSIEELKKNFEQSLQRSKLKKNEEKESVNSEVRVIQSAIIRISALMAIGFGEAGGEILKENISSSEGLNPMLQGKKIQAIFGFCFIHHFSDINEALQESIMIFVNHISDIVHSSVDKFGGITNKNLGDCFLLAWKIKDNAFSNERNESKRTPFIEGIVENEKKLAWHADSALLSFLNIIKKINKSQIILSYRRNPKLIQKFGPKYSVQMGFGLHTGWGIEGAIGSFYKIDCSYLSPNVNIAARLETATNIYGVDILFSGEFYDMLSDYMKAYCREIDIVTLKGSAKPVRLYTVDLNKKLREGKKINKKTRMTLREKRNYYAYKKRKLLHKYQDQGQINDISITEVYLKQSRGLKQLLHKTKSELFYTYFNEGFSSYIDGDWDEAYSQLSKAKYLEKNDGPTKVLINHIKSYKCQAPSDWDGFRALLAKC